MPIDAVYRDGNKSVTVDANDVDSKTYLEKYKGKLFCSTDNCNARLSLVFRASRPNFFKTWRNDNHNEDCLHYFDRVADRTGVNVENVISLALSEAHKRRALKEAYAQSKMTEEQIEEQKQRRKSKRRKNSVTNRKRNNSRVDIALNSQEEDTQEIEQFQRRKSPSLYKRNVDNLKDSDIGKPRLIIGQVVDTVEKEDFARITVKHGNKIVSVNFEEAFFANSANFKGLFHHIKKFKGSQGNITFTGIGEVRRSKKDGEIEVAIYSGDDFYIEGKRLPSIAALLSH
ncbi:hypothetical protein [Sediminibacillus albus]|uniref:Uncharacterized protein n=1 Tax=Sediminibacillus albus TaxID=407036 RepID=A0A1G8X785_9BACI|nr:hypothetical protein [Sediminibacillus albus]SDJ86237.1 hypothetical protein SAMN05216243_1196 [Sediminibacillus albus]